MKSGKCMKDAHYFCSFASESIVLMPEVDRHLTSITESANLIDPPKSEWSLNLNDPPKSE